MSGPIDRHARLQTVAAARWKVAIALTGAMIVLYFGFVMLIASLLGVVGGIIFARIAAEFILIVFRINEHLGAIRNRGDF